MCCFIRFHTWLMPPPFVLSSQHATWDGGSIKLVNDTKLAQFLRLGIRVLKSPFDKYTFCSRFGMKCMFCLAMEQVDSSQLVSFQVASVARTLGPCLMVFFCLLELRTMKRESIMWSQTLRPALFLFSEVKLASFHNSNHGFEWTSYGLQWMNEWEVFKKFCEKKWSES